MFYSMIQTAREKWFASSECKINAIIKYMESTGELRDAQLDAIKTYLFLKIGCNNLPLYELFCTGRFNKLTKDELNNIPMSVAARNKLLTDSAALALYEYAIQKNENGEQVSEKLEKAIIDTPDEIEYKNIFKKIFYDVTYTDYLFSLPMGAGKTFLMSAFIYLDLYFATQEPDNPIFAHNFIILAPSGLKTSVIPSLRTIQEFNPAWIISEPSANNLKKMISFEVLDQSKTAKKSNKAKNPNVQKIAQYQPLENCLGLVAVTNAEKVILDGLVKDDGQQDLFEDSKDKKDRESNELRYWIGKLPNLAIYIDEVHHATDSDIKLRSVVNKWMQNETVTGVIGFSGTPYLESSEKIEITESLNIKSLDISNTVYYYPLVDAIGNFLKYPIVKISTSKDSSLIIEEGIKEFLNKFKDTVYERGSRELTAKLAIYCGKGIDFLEEEVYPLVSTIVTQYGLNPDEVILRYHDGNKNHPQPTDSEYEFKILDKTESKKKIILLCQIGKEGWNCRSLTGVILSQEGDCPTNMVLQTSCRCLRQVERGKKEEALIYLNDSNYQKLRKQLEQQQHINLEQFQSGKDIKEINIKRYDRTKYLNNLPPIEMYQLSIKYDTEITEQPETANELNNVINAARNETTLTKEFDMKLVSETHFDINDKETGNIIADYEYWIYTIVKESYGFLTIEKIKEYNNILRNIFDNHITYVDKNSNIRYFSSKYNISLINETIRKSFYEKRELHTTEEVLKEAASLLRIENFTNEIIIPEERKGSFYPNPDVVEKIFKADCGELGLSDDEKQLIALLRKMGKESEAQEYEMKGSLSIPKDKSFHYMPYRTDSNFEQKFLEEILKENVILNSKLEVFYNGDGSLTDFRIKCYQKTPTGWGNVGEYTPDFLIVLRNDNNEIFKAIIVETKGSLYAKDPNFKLRKDFVENVFIPKNAELFKYKKFDYLYLEDTLSETDRIKITIEKIKDFFAKEINNAN